MARASSPATASSWTAAGPRGESVCPLPVTSTWLAHRVAHSHPDPQRFSPDRLDATWRPLGQAWLGSAPQKNFRPGWARLGWHPHFLDLAFVFSGGPAHNAARQLNERTWELGDVGEFFIRPDSAPHYLEIHLTPENQRLQLNFPLGGIARLRSGEAPLESFIVTDPDWVFSATHITSDFWTAQARIPAAALGFATLANGLVFQTAVCRYDCGITSTPTLSATASFTAPFFHQLDAWSQLVLID
jgi:hypothetical protein